MTGKKDYSPSLLYILITKRSHSTNMMVTIIEYISTNSITFFYLKGS